MANIMNNSYYASFTDSAISSFEEKVFWDRFASPDGVRLTLEVEAANPNFRRITYGPPGKTPIPILADVADCLATKYNRLFTLRGISRLCLFYLANGYDSEQESRIVYRDWASGGPVPVGRGKSSYVEIPLGITTSGFNLKVVDVCSRSRPTMPDEYTFTKRS
jgi:hypothetical protein